QKISARNPPRIIMDDGGSARISARRVRDNSRWIDVPVSHIRRFFLYLFGLKLSGLYRLTIPSVRRSFLPAQPAAVFQPPRFWRLLIMIINFALPFKRQTKIAIVALLFCCALFVPAHQAQKKQPSGKKPAGNIDDKTLRQADSHPGDWMTHGRTYSEARYSPLKRIDSSNIQRLGWAWSFDTQTNRGLEATPLVVDGVMYTTGSWSVVHALDAKTGDQLWKYDPQIARSYGARACCDVVNRGVAVYKGKVYVGAL